MSRIQVKRMGMEKYVGSIYPRMQENFKKAKVDSRKCVPYLAGDLRFEMDYENWIYVVDLIAKTCGCKIWDLNEIPCKCAVSCISKQIWKPEPYVYSYYSKETYLKGYENMINPLPREHDWERTSNDPIQPSFQTK